MMDTSTRLADSDVSPFHAGELAVQQRAGSREQVEAAGRRLIRDHMPDQHRELFGKIPTFLVGGLDAHRRPWASMLCGRPGFVDTPDASTLRIAALPDDGDPLRDALAVGAPIGLLGIEPATRRRNRINGRVIARDEGGFSVGVEQSFGNCPKYIQARTPEWRPHQPGEALPAAQSLGARLDGAAAALVCRADTLYIATAAPAARANGGAEGVDVSHRGGNPGFVRQQQIDGASVLTLPDFKGNGLFNTFGNIVANPRAGLFFFDPDRGDVLQLTGTAELIWDGDEVAQFAGALRLLRLVVDEALWRPAALPLRWSAAEFAPQLAATGRWQDAA
jgi:uncharacterized protein